MVQLTWVPGLGPLLVLEAGQHLQSRAAERNHFGLLLCGMRRLYCPSVTKFPACSLLGFILDKLADTGVRGPLMLRDFGAFGDFSRLIVFRSCSGTQERDQHISLADQKKGPFCSRKTCAPSGPWAEKAV